jgi:hypothetical protein
MRRRTMWQLAVLDGRAGQLAGIGHSVLAHLFDTKVPANLNDSDLNIGMKELPVPHIGTTEMTFCLIRYEVGTFLRKSSTAASYDGSWSRLSSSAVGIGQKDAAIDELEILMHKKYLKYCDPVVPMHFLCFGMSRTVIAKMRLLAHKYSIDPSPMPQEDRDSLFSNSIYVMEYDDLGQRSDALLRFRWHMNSHFQLDAFIYMVSELRQRTAGELVDRAWELVESSYSNHTEFFSQYKNPLTVATGNLTLKAWEERQKALAPVVYPVPPYIAQLAAQRLRKKSKTNSNSNTSASPHQSLLETTAPMAGIEVPDLSTQNNDNFLDSLDFDPQKLFESLPADQVPIDWDYWAEVSQGVEYNVEDVGNMNVDIGNEYYGGSWA